MTTGYKFGGTSTNSFAVKGTPTGKYTSSTSWGSGSASIGRTTSGTATRTTMSSVGKTSGFKPSGGCVGCGTKSSTFAFRSR